MIWRQNEQEQRSLVRKKHFQHMFFNLRARSISIDILEALESAANSLHQKSFGSIKSLVIGKQFLHSVDSLELQ